MSRTLTITLNLYDYPDIVPYALEIVKDSIGTAFVPAEFEKAELDGEPLIAKDGTASQDVTQLKQYTHIMDKLRGKH